jgi:gamma-glutamylcyclotransferase (GGCT)/AIG2-like uncharacterized protein YtfP
MLWKLGSEWANLMRLLWPRFGTKIHYFAFGANLDESVLALRRIRVLDTYDFVLQGAALRFSLTGFYAGHGYASADAADGEVVYGRMYLILESDARRMDYFEGVPYLNAHEKVFREIDGMQFYYYRNTEIVDGLKPTREYLDYLLKAYESMEIVPQPYLEQLKTTEVLEEFMPIENTGTFVSDLSRWPKLFRPGLLGYERLMLKFVEVTWHKSLIQWAIKP